MRADGIREPQMQVRTNLPMVAWLLVLSISCVCSAQEEREVWEYVGGRGQSWIAHVEGNKWVNYLGDGNTLIYLEVQRTDGYVQLQGVGSNALEIRLRQTSGELLKPGGDWIRWNAPGKWTDRSSLPPTAKMFSGHEIRVLYFVPSDRKPIQNYEAKIRVILAYVEELYKQALQVRGHDLKQLPFERDRGQPVVHLVTADKPASYFNEGWSAHDGAQMSRIAAYLKQHVYDPARRLTLVIPETWELGPAEEAWPGHEARGTSYDPDGGLAVYSAWILQDQFCATNIRAQRKHLFDSRPVVGRRSFFSKPNSPVYEFVENGIGGVAHELGHAFGLSHDYRASSVDIMGGGFRNIRFNFDPRARPDQRVGFSEENTHLLMSSRYLATDIDAEDYTPPRAEVSIVRSVAGELRAKLMLSDDIGLRALVVRHRRPGSADVAQGRALSGKKVTIEMPIDIQVTPETMDVRFVVTDLGGNITEVVVPPKNFVPEL